VALGAVFAGSLFLYAALTGRTVLGSVKALISGKAPATVTPAASSAVPVAADIANAAAAAAGSVTLSPAGNTGAANAGAAANQATAKMLAASMGHAGWTTGQQWADWVSLWNQESGWNIDAANPASAARGIAQNINGYGPTYLQGSAQSQITWGINYIAGRYGSPSAAWAHEVSSNWY
jgi:hypothetical protein